MRLCLQERARIGAKAFKSKYGASNALAVCVRAKANA
jgi:hypothetical protein